MQPRLGILGSTRGTDLIALINGSRTQQLCASIEVVVSNQKTAGILSLAQSYQLPTFYSESEAQTSEIFLQEKVDLIVLIGYMKILSETFLTIWDKKIINVHPSLLPKYTGGMDKNIHEMVLKNKDSESGCTVHYVTNAVDAGPIIIQKKCFVHVDDTADTLKNRVQTLEGEALIEAINKIGNPYA